MLAKMWKKIALVICIVAIIFNIMYKLINKTNLKSELQSVVGGEAISFSDEVSTADTDDTEEN